MKRRFVVVVVVAVLLSGAFAGTPARAAFPGARGGFAYDNGANIFTMLSDGSGRKQLTKNGDSVNPRWSPDGTKIAFNSRKSGALFVMSATGTNLRRIGGLTRAYQPAWSANAKQLVYVNVPKGQQGEIWSVPVAGGPPKQLTIDGALGCGNSHPEWSKSGLLAYDHCPGPPERDAWHHQVIVVNNRAATKTVIDEALKPHFTADSRGLIFTSRSDEFGGPYQDLVATDLLGHHAVNLSQDVCVEGDPCFHEGTASPASTFPGNPRAAWIEDRQVGGRTEDHYIDCFVSSTAEFCSKPDQGLGIYNFDWQPLS